jgi:2-dehydro-3-deoxygluconokinase
MTTPDGVILCIGEALITLAPADGQPLETTRQLEVSAGGAEFNVAVQLARLGFATRFAGMVGADPWGRRLVAALRGEGVDTSSVLTHPRWPTGCYVKELKPGKPAVYYYRARSAASSLGRLPDGARERVVHVHLSGITPALSASCLGLVQTELDHAGSRTTSFDINYRPGLWAARDAAPVLLHLAGKASYVFVGLDEARLLWECTTPGDIRRLFPEPVELIVKNGSGAAIAFAAGENAAAQPDHVEVVDVIGAGDAFAAGYLARRLRGAGIEAALHGGHAVAGAVIRSSTDNGRPDQIAALAPLFAEAPDAS